MATRRDSTLQDIPDLTAAQIRAVDGLITGMTDTQAAAVGGVHRVTLNGWKLHNPAFVAALNARRREAWEASGQRLRALLPDALARIEHEISDTSSPGGLRAALRVVEIVMGGQGIDTLSKHGPTEPEEVLEAIALDARPAPHPTEAIIRELNGDGEPPVSARERQAVLDNLRDLGAFEGPPDDPDDGQDEGASSRE